MQEQLPRKRKSDVLQHDNCMVSVGTPCLLRGVVAYMDVGKEREQDAEAFEWRPSFGYFAWAVARKVTRRQGESRGMKLSLVSDDNHKSKRGWRD